MHNEFTAIVEQDGRWYIAYCPEVPGANGQGTTVEKAKASLAEAVKLILEDRREDALKGLPVRVEAPTYAAEVELSLLCRQTDAEKVWAELSRVTDGRAARLSEEELYAPWESNAGEKE